MKLFGRTIFEEKNLETLYDFAQHGLLRASEQYDYAQPVAILTAPGNNKTAGQEKRKKKELTPKALYELKTLNQPAFAVNCDPGYIDEQIEVLIGKLTLLAKAQKPSKKNPFPIIGPEAYGRMECESMIQRLNNRRKFEEFQSNPDTIAFDEWPYTTSEAIQKLVTDHEHLTPW
jgi:hypothetical protein